MRTESGWNPGMLKVTNHKSVLPWVSAPASSKDRLILRNRTRLTCESMFDLQRSRSSISLSPGGCFVWSLLGSVHAGAFFFFFFFCLSLCFVSCSQLPAQLSVMEFCVRGLTKYNLLTGTFHLTGDLWHKSDAAALLQTRVSKQMIHSDERGLIWTPSIRQKQSLLWVTGLPSQCAQAASIHSDSPSEVKAFSNRIANASNVIDTPPHTHTHSHEAIGVRASAHAHVSPSLSDCSLNHWIPPYTLFFFWKRSSRTALIQSVPFREKRDGRRRSEGGRDGGRGRLRMEEARRRQESAGEISWLVNLIFSSCWCKVYTPSPCGSHVHGVVCRQTEQKKQKKSLTTMILLSFWYIFFFPLPLHFCASAASVIIGDGFYLILLHLIMVVSRVCSGSQGQAGEPIWVVAMTTYGEAAKLSVVSATAKLDFESPAIDGHMFECLFFLLRLKPCHRFVPQWCSNLFLFPSSVIYSSMFWFLKF